MFSTQWVRSTDVYVRFDEPGHWRFVSDRLRTVARECIDGVLLDTFQCYLELAVIHRSVP